MKVALVSLRPKKSIVWVRKEIRKANLPLDYKHPDIVLSVGGDGSFFEAERKRTPKIIKRTTAAPKIIYRLSISPLLDKS